MNLDPSSLSTRELYGLMVGVITPRPIAWVSTLSADGIANLAPYSFFNGVGANPPTVMFCPANRRDGTAKDTLANIQRTGEFVVNIVTDDVAKAMNLTAAEVQPDEDEFELAELSKQDSLIVKPPRVADSQVAIECVLHTALGLGTGPGGANLVIGRIVAIFVHDDLMDPSGKLKSDELSTVGRMGGAQYVRTSDRFEMGRPGT